MALELSGLVGDLPNVLTGKKVTPQLIKLRQVYWSAFAYSFFKQISQNFSRKSKGSADKQGLKWKPLTKKTKAYRPRNTRNKGRGLLTGAQDSLWKGIFAKNFKKFSATMPEDEAKGKAAALAWAILKNQGAKTKIDEYGNKNVPILVRTGRLRNSLKPGKYTGDNYIPFNDDQFFKFDRGKMVLGSKVPYAGEVEETRSLYGDSDTVIAKAIEFATKELAKAMKNL
jgi:hypothetical protein